MAGDPETFRAVLIEQMDVLHAETIWRKYKDRFGKLPKTRMDRKSESATAEKSIETPEKVESSPFASSAKTSATTLDPRSKLSKIERGDEIHALYTNPAPAQRLRQRLEQGGVITVITPHNRSSAGLQESPPLFGSPAEKGLTPICSITKLITRCD
jgi:hypothetical protein